MTFLSSTDLWNLSPDGFFLVDHDGAIRSINKAALAMFGGDAEQILGKPIESLLPDRARGDHVSLRDGYLARPESRAMGDARSLQAQDLSGNAFPAMVALTPLRVRDEDFVFAAVRDLTDRVEGEQMLAKANRQRAQAEDSDRIATELHDNVVQRLFVLGLDLHQLSSKIEEPSARERLDRAVDIVDDTIREIRNTIFDLTSPRAPSVSLRRDVEEIAIQLEQRRGIPADLRFSGAIDALDPKVYGVPVKTVLNRTLDLIAAEAATETVSISVQASDVLVIEVEAVGDDAPAGLLLDDLRDVWVASGPADLEVEHADSTTKVLWSVAL